MAKEYEKLMDELYYMYRKSGFTIVEIRCDNEFRKALDTFAAKQTLPIRMNYASANKHVPRAERNNRTIQERVWCNYYQLPYVHISRIIVKYLVSESAKKLNFFPNKNGVSKYYSPRMILHRRIWISTSIVNMFLENMYKHLKMIASRIIISLVHLTVYI